jgi:hypothetical protein
MGGRDDLQDSDEKSDGGKDKNDVHDGSVLRHGIPALRYLFPQGRCLIRLYGPEFLTDKQDGGYGEQECGHVYGEDGFQPSGGQKYARAYGGQEVLSGGGQLNQSGGPGELSTHSASRSGRPCRPGSAARKRPNRHRHPERFCPCSTLRISGSGEGRAPRRQLRGHPIQSTPVDRIGRQADRPRAAAIWTGETKPAQPRRIRTLFRSRRKHGHPRRRPSFPTPDWKEAGPPRSGGNEGTSSVLKFSWNKTRSDPAASVSDIRRVQPRVTYVIYLRFDGSDLCSMFEFRPEH